ncbi:MAG: rRNA (uracil1939-C5)-methyltransferase [Acidobacteriota bacterium]|jgi:tRNA/tmRNA/rRNA uracil-C5-methylase (TrmA/RlmC/RlmD family)|nr:rRNA (uracil1939-C5)-methyltransferase [Acidobacteriota bacterium]
MRVGDELTVKPEKLVAGGESLSRVEGVPVFAPNLYPGDVAVVRLTEVKKGFARGAVVRVVEASADRRAEPCPIADECGGCDWTSLRLDRQLVAKREILTESLRRIGRFDPASLPEIRVHPSPLNYRLRSRLHQDGDAVGFYATGSHRVVPLARECEVVGIETAHVIPSVARDPGGWGAGIFARHPPGSLADARDDIWEIDGRLIAGEEELTIDVGDYHYRLSTGAFFQVNRHLLGTMIRLVTAHASRVVERGSAIDLYAGVGFFTVPLARMFERVISVEGSPLSHRYAQLNAPENVTLVHAAVESYVRRMPEADFLFLDPPRAGARQEVIEAAGEKARRAICYLSCDPVTFARDAQRLSASGWRLTSLDLLDLFPNTHHVETLSSFERAG